MITRQDYQDYVYLHSDLVLTTFNEGDDILTYTGSKNVYVVKRDKTDVQVEAEIACYHEITEEQHFEYERQRREKEFPEEVEAEEVAEQTNEILNEGE